MKRVYIALAFLAVSISLCIFEQYTVNTMYKDTCAYIDKAIEYTEKEDYGNARKECRKLNKYWAKKYPCLTAMIDHGPLDEAGVTIDSLDELAKEENEDLKESLVTAKSQIKSIHENQSISFGNIF